MSRSTVPKVPLHSFIESVFGFDVVPADFVVIRLPSGDFGVREILEDVLKSFVGRRYEGNRANDISQSGGLEKDLAQRLQQVFGDVVVVHQGGAGYPDIWIIPNDPGVIRDRNGRDLWIYIEVKVTSNTRKSRGSARDFYITPGTVDSFDLSAFPEIKIGLREGETHKKIRAPGPHILVLFGASKLADREWEITSVTAYDIRDLGLKLKPEFNANYKDIEDNCELLLKVSKSKR